MNKMIPFAKAEDEKETGMKKNNLLTMMFLIFAVIGIGLMAGAIILFAKGTQFGRSAVSITGEIADIMYSGGNDGNTDHEVFVNYTFAGKEYEMVRINEYSSSMQVGQSISLLCDPENPWDVRTKSGMYLGFIILMCLGIVFFCIGVVPLTILGLKKQKNKRLLANGRVLYATVESIDRNRCYEVNGKNPYVIYCIWKDEYAETLYRFKSGSLWTNPALIFPEGSEIEVYVDPNNFRKYYVDAERKLSQKIVDLT